MAEASDHFLCDRQLSHTSNLSAGQAIYNRRVDGQAERQYYIYTSEKDNNGQAGTQVGPEGT